MINSNITRDRELADLLYNSMRHLLQLQADLEILKDADTSSEQPLALIDAKAPAVADILHHPPVLSDTAKALADAIKQISSLIQLQEQVIHLLLQNHTDASSIMNEFEKIRTAKLLNSEHFELAHLIKPHHP